MLRIPNRMVIQHAMPRTRCPFKFQNRYPSRQNMASACIQLFFVGIPKAVPAADVFPPKPLQIHLVYIAPKDLPRAYAPSASVGVASVGHERTKGESRGLFARCERTIAAAAAVGELLSPLWKSICFLQTSSSSLTSSLLAYCDRRRRQRRPRAHQRRIEG